jgi:predicted PurR-regulated permease PerM
VEDSKDTVMRFSAAMLSASVAITLLPDDVATPLADSLADMNIYFVAILMILFFEKILIVYGFKLAAVVLPIACAIYALSIILKQDAMKSLAVRLSILVLAVALVVPCSTHVTNYVAADLTQYVEATIEATEDGADKINEARNVGEDEKTVFEKLSESFKTAIDDISDLMLYFQNSIRKCINSIAILLMTNCLMPILNFFLLKWILKETFNVAVPTPRLRRKRHSDSNSDSDSNNGSGTLWDDFAAVGE